MARNPADLCFTNPTTFNFKGFLRHPLNTIKRTLGSGQGLGRIKTLHEKYEVPMGNGQDLAFVIMDKIETAEYNQESKKVKSLNKELHAVQEYYKLHTILPTPAEKSSQGIQQQLLAEHLNQIFLKYNVKKDLGSEEGFLRSGKVLLKSIKDRGDEFSDYDFFIVMNYFGLCTIESLYEEYNIPEDLDESSKLKKLLAETEKVNQDHHKFVKGYVYAV